MTSHSKIALLGTAGVPGRYGGFETLAENLVHYHALTQHSATLNVWCSGKDNAEHPDYFESADLRYVSLSANGSQSILYDAISLWQAVRSGHDQILLLGVSGAIALPLIRLLSRARIVTNIDGIEWKRAKWKGPARWFLKWSEKLAVKFSHEVVADNWGIAEHVREYYGRDCHVIAYGGDHAVKSEPTQALDIKLPVNFALALCRIEPENNVAMILEAFSRIPEHNLVFVGNWNKSDYGKGLRRIYGDHPNITLLDPIYDPGRLRWVRDGAELYVHGHSAGGTNPSLVEMMHFGLPVLAYDCNFNRHTTEERALYFKSPDVLCEKVSMLNHADCQSIGHDMKEIALRRYTWSVVGKEYFNIICDTK